MKQKFKRKELIFQPEEPASSSWLLFAVRFGVQVLVLFLLIDDIVVPVRLWRTDHLLPGFPCYPVEPTSQVTDDEVREKLCVKYFFVP